MPIPLDATPSMPALPPDEPSTGLAGRRKSIILGGIVVVLLVAVGATALWQKRPNNKASTSNLSTVVNTTVTNTAPSSNRPTFERFNVKSVPTTLTKPVVSPTPAELRQQLPGAINNLQKK